MQTRSGVGDLLLAVSYYAKDSGSLRIRWLHGFNPDHELLVCIKNNRREALAGRSLATVFAGSVSRFGAI